MKWWWSGQTGETMTEDEFLELMDNSLCSDFVDFLEVIENKGYYIPFITTVNYLTHSVSRSSLKIKDYSKLKN
jgi:hypothetical protein